MNSYLKSMWQIIFIVNLNGFRIAMETYLGMSTKVFSKGLAEQGRWNLNMDNVIS